MKSVFTAILAFCMLTAFSQIPSYVPTNGLVGYWPFNGNANDESGNGNNGTVNGATLTADRFGNVGKAYIFDGMNDFIGTNKTPFIGSSSRSINAWVNYNQLINICDADMALVSWGANSGSCNQAGGNFGLFINYYLNSPAHLSLDGVCTVKYQDYHQSILSRGWNMITAVFDSISGLQFSNIKLYLNGQLIPSSDYNGQTIVNTLSNSSLTFGKCGYECPRFYSGMMDDIAIYRRALTQSEITTLYNSGTNTCLPSYLPTNGLVGYWPFCGNANDESGNGNNGTVNGASLTTDRFGNANTAYSFNGSSSLIEIPDSNKFNLSRDFTISSWVNAIDFGTQRSIVTKYKMLDDAFSFDIKNAKLSLQTASSPANWITATSNQNLQSNTWYHLVGIKDYTNRLFKLYVNGELIFTQSCNDTTSRSGANLIFGNFKNNSSNPSVVFSGKLDDIAIYNRALTQTEITTLYTGVAASNCIANILQSDTTICSGSSLTLNAAAVTPATVTDIDGNVYPTVNIGSQTWTQKNLNVSKYKNGDIIPQVTNPTQWLNLNTGAWCWYNNDSTTYAATYGKLYNWYAVTDPRGLAPEGWSVPSDTEWSTLENYLGGAFYAGQKMKSISNLWQTPGSISSNESGFSALPGGLLQSIASVNFFSVNQYAHFWSKSIEQTSPISRYLAYDDISSHRVTSGASYGKSVRCLKINAQTNTYLWSTGDTTASINVSPTQTTTYYVTVNNGTNSCTDSVTVTVNGGNLFAQDTIRHCGASYSLTLGAGYSSYSWSTGQTTASINVTTSKWYRCTVTLNGCTSTDSVYLQITNPLSIPVPASITIQSIQTNVCGSRRYRYIAPILPVNATGYQWSFVGSLYNGSGTIDSGTLTSRIITVTYSSNSACGAGDSIKLRYNTICGFGNWRALKLSNLALLPPNTPASITVQAVSQNNCGARRYRYIAPALPAATASTAAATGWQWELVGSLAEFATIDSGDENSQKIVVTYSVNSAAQTGDSIKLFYQSNCGNGKTRAIKMTNLKLNPPVIPACIFIQPVATNICGARRYRYLAHNLPNATTTSGAATGWQWTMPTGNLGLSATLDSGTLTSKVIIIRYSSNAAAGVGDSIKIRYNSDCGYSPYRAVRLTNTLLNPPAAPASITMTLVQNNCGARIYRYTAPTLPAATTANGAASGYDWMMPFSPLGSQGTLDSGTLTSRTIRILYPSNDASQAGDSIRVRYNSACGYGPYKTMKLSNTAKTGCPPITKPSVPYSKNADVKMDEQKLSVLVYPNPSAQQFRLKLSSQSSSIVRVGLFDMQGKRISQMQLSANSVIDFGNDLKPGVYHLEVVQDKERQTVRIVKY